MSPAEPDAVRSAARAAFLARVTAGATHEIRNVLAIVKESAGLVGDLVSAGGPGRDPDPSKVDWALDRIRLQVARGAELSTALNRVMHGLDEPEGPVELGPAVEHAVLLARRFARQHECEIEHVPGSGGSPIVVCNGLDLSMALVWLMEWCVDRLPPGSTLEVRSESSEDGPVVQLVARDTGDASGVGSERFGEMGGLLGVAREGPAVRDEGPDRTAIGPDRRALWAEWVSAEIRAPNAATVLLQFRQRDDIDGEMI